MVTKIRTEQDARDFVRGCTFMGTGGGGPQDVGLRYLLEDLEKGLDLGWVDPMSIPDEAVTCMSLFMGSIAPARPEIKSEMAAKGLIHETVEREMVASIEGLAARMGVEKFDALVPFELGGINTPAPVDAAARLNMPVVDGDYSGRALPELPQASPMLYDFPLTPVVSCDRWGNVLTIEKAVNSPMVEVFGKGFSTNAMVICAESGLVVKGKDMKKAIIPGTLTKCLNVGRTIRQAREAGENPLQAVMQAADAWQLFEGVVSGKSWVDADGYLIGDCTIDGTGKFEGHTFKIWYKNENHVSWLDGKPFVCSPDLIEVVDAATAEPITNTDIQQGQRVAVLGMRGNDQFRTEKGLSILSARYYGFDYDYIPIENLVD